MVHADNSDVNSLLFIERTYYIAAPVNTQFKNEMCKMHSAQDEFTILNKFNKVT